jgi:hypothetical protein
LNGSLAVLLPPTAVQVLAEVHESAFSTLWRGGKAVCCTVQVLPFHRSASAALPVPPTAVHRLADVQNTPFRPPGQDAARPVDGCGARGSGKA